MPIETRPALWLVIVLAIAAGRAQAKDESEKQDAAREIAAAAPANDIYVVPLRRVQGQLQFGEPVNATHRPGYDNQPAFMPDGKRFYYTSIREDGQADVWRYDLASGESQQVTKTQESEYSPTVPPDGVGFSTVRVEKNGHQRLWRYGEDGTPGKPIVDDENAVGYYAWIDADTLALFIVGEPNTLEVYDLRSDHKREIAKPSSRCIQTVPARPSVAYIEADAERGPWLKLLSWPGGLTRLLTQPLDGSEDFVLSNDGELYMAREQRLYGWQHQAGKWDVVADYSGKLPGAISRLAVNKQGDTMALVVAEGPEPKP